MVSFDLKSHQTSLKITEEIRVKGTVQGVGFRPTVYRLAKANQLLGEVSNDGQGVLIIVVGHPTSIDNFIQQLEKEKPPLARITEIIRHQMEEIKKFTDFSIIKSNKNLIKTEIAPDAATCESCKAETFDPYTRWYRYPFTNCTNCGPRLSIIKHLPYDRIQTSMADFLMCRECQEDYDDPLNRRFHAQPIACHICGPKAWLERADGKPVNFSMFSMLDDVDAVATLIQQGYIIAIKGLGGFHLACDATNEEVVAKLRKLKKRPDKPLALMAKDIQIIDQYCYINQAEKELLQSPAAPIVLLKQKNSAIANSVALGHNYLGFMLPYTPLHHLIFKRLKNPVVFTSANLADEPQCIDNEDAKQKLASIAHYLLLHNREIVNRVDDSVVRILPNSSSQILRRGRGYAPTPIDLPAGFENIAPILAMGSELKNTFCLLREGQGILSQHIGDLENLAAWESYRHTLELYLGLLEYKITENPQLEKKSNKNIAIAVDLHPEYLATKHGKELAANYSLPIYFTQHHHAHIAACMVENGLPIDTQRILGIALDGLGYGEDGTFWGGEFLLADYHSYKRVGTFKPVAMLGGEKAIYEPWRNTYAHLQAAFGDDENSIFSESSEYKYIDLVKFFRKKPLKLLSQMEKKGINSPLASSCGRLFDAVAAAIGICRESCSYEGQGAIALESIAESWILNHPKETGVYSFAVQNKELKEEFNLLYLESRWMWQELLVDLQKNISQGAMAAKFHRGLAKGIVLMVKEIRNQYPEAKINQVALTGGVFQNQILLTQVWSLLEEMDIKVLTHSRIPPNDGGLSLGQAAIAASRIAVNKFNE